MKTYSERTAQVREIITKKKKQKRAVAGICLTVAVVILALTLFLPYSTTPPSVARYGGSEYYDVICRLNEITYEKPRYANNFEMLTSALRKAGATGMDDAPMMDAIEMPNAGADSESAEEYVEVTDNQVQGVTEADIFKRSDRYVYYLRGAELSVYTIQGEESELVGTFLVEAPSEDSGSKQEDESEDIVEQLQYISYAEMYLSEDCTTVTLVMGCYSGSTGRCTVLVNLDVTDPGNIRQSARIFLTGDYLSSRSVDGTLLLTQNFYVSDHDFDDPATFVPAYGTPENMTCIDGEDILCPDTAQSSRYTVVYSLDQQTLTVESAVAMLGYSQELYVSRDTIYATHQYDSYSQEDADGYRLQAKMTDITGISYAGGELKVLGTVSVEGELKDQYSMDQYAGTLRVVATTRTWDHWRQNGYERVSMASRNVSLYCVDLESWEVVASVIGFAPEGEEATAVRFDGPNAYVCTAEIVTLTDPVYFFDLSDPENITYTDTGIIEGYSTSLIELGDGFLLGIGYGGDGQLKVEVYEESEDGVISVCVWERDAYFSEEYKTYYIDRERNLIGLAMADNRLGTLEYVLLHFDGYGLRSVLTHSFDEYIKWSSVRAFLADGNFYILEENNGFAVENLKIFG